MCSSITALSCNLLLPYPGGGAPEEAFRSSGSGFANAENPLQNPPIDPSVSVSSELSVSIALPESGFPIRLTYETAEANVVGGGIRISNSEEVQWTLADDSLGQTNGTVELRYIIDELACEGIPNLCHEVITEQFVITQSPTSNQLSISSPVTVPVILQCATCESLSCVELIPLSVGCRTCEQPASCAQLYDQCYAPGASEEASEAAALFNAFLSQDGTLWTNRGSCIEGEILCNRVLEGGSCNFDPNAGGS